jgi:hypothetical protein
MREHLYKAKRKLNGNWVCGYYVYNEDENKHFIYAADLANDRFEIIHETLCQFTSLFDKKGDRIFTGDIISDGDPMNTGEVEFDIDCGCVFVNSHATLHVSQYCNHYSVIGSIHDHETA